MGDILFIWSSSIKFPVIYFTFATNVFGDNLVWNFPGRTICFGIFFPNTKSEDITTPLMFKTVIFFSLWTLVSISCTTSEDISTVPMLSKVARYSFARLLLMLELSVPKIRLIFAFLLSDQCSTYRQRLLGHCTQLASVLCRGGFSHCRPPKTDRLDRFLFV